MTNLSTIVTNLNTIVLPWPPKELSPNGRVHRLKKAAVAKKYREACFWITKESKVKISDKRVPISIIFYEPDRRSRDLDNMLAAIKSGIDGMADALGVNDKIFRPLTIDVADQIGGMIKIQFSNA